MARDLPTDQGWYPRELLGGRYLQVFEILSDPDDPDWYPSATIRLKDRRAFWSEEDGQGLGATLNTTAKWVHFNHLKKVSQISNGAGDLRSWGSIGKQGSFFVELANVDGLLDDIRYGANSGGLSAGTSPSMATGEWENRWARIGIMHRDPDGTLAYPGSIVWLGAGRIGTPEQIKGGLRIKVTDNRLQGKLEIPRTVYQNDESVFAGFRAANTVHGRVKPWLFGHVPIATGYTVVLGYEDATDLRGRRVEFYGLDESWQQKGSVTGLKYGDEDVVDATDTRGFLEINQDTGGWVADRSAYTAMSNGQAFHFDVFNQEWLYLKMDVRLSYADTLRDTTDPVALVTNPTNVVDWKNTDTLADMPARSEDASPFNSYAFVPIPWPNFGGFALVIEGSWTGSWRDRDMQPPTPGIDVGMYVFWKYNTQSKLVSNGAYVFADANAALYAGGGNYTTNSADGPARFIQGDAVIDNFTTGDRELYQMLHRDNSGDGSGPSTGTINLSDFETRQGEGKAILFGVCAPNGEGGGASAILAGVDLYNIGIRIWGRIKFPEVDGWFAEGYGYSMKVDFDSWASGIALNDTYNTPLGILGLFLDRILPTHGPDLLNFLVQDTFLAGINMEIGKQLLDSVDAFDEMNLLCEDSHVLMLGSENLSNEITADGLTHGNRAVFLPKLGLTAYRFTDKAPPFTPASADILVKNCALGSADSGIVPGSVEPYKADLKDVYTRFVYKFRWNPLTRDYDGVVTISPTEWELGEYMTGAGTYLDQTTIQALLADAETKYRRKPELATLKYEAGWIHDGPTAEYMLAFLILNTSQPRHGVKFKTGAVPIHVRLGDPVEVDLRDLPDEWNTKYEDLEPGEDERLYIVGDMIVDSKAGRIRWDLMEVKPHERFPAVPFW